MLACPIICPLLLRSKLVLHVIQQETFYAKLKCRNTFYMSSLPHAHCEDSQVEIIAICFLDALFCEIACLNPHEYVAAKMSDSVVLGGSEVRMKFAVRAALQPSTTYLSGLHDGVLSRLGCEQTSPALSKQRMHALRRRVKFRVYSTL